MSRDHQELMNTAYEKFHSPDIEWKERFRTTGLTNLEKVAVMLGNFNYQVCNGGFMQYADNGYASDTGPDGTGVHAAIAGIVDAHRDLAPDIADNVLAMMRHIEEAPKDWETEEEVVGTDEDPETGEIEEVTETVNLRERHFAETDRFDRVYYAFPQERVEAFYQAILNAWDENEDPFDMPFSFDSAPKAPTKPAAGDVRYPDVAVRLVGEDGNAHAIMGRVAAALRRARVPSEEIDSSRKEARSGDYQTLLAPGRRWGDCAGGTPASPKPRPPRGSASARAAFRRWKPMPAR